MHNKTIQRGLLAFVAVLMLALTACTTAGQPADGSADLPGDVQTAVISTVAEEMGYDQQDVIIVSGEQATWQDSCLGAGGPAESCLRADTPGYLVMVEVDGEPVEVRTDETGQQVRIVGGE